MSWLEDLVTIYDNNEYRIGKYEDIRGRKVALLPIYHKTQSAHLEITVTREGKFKDVKVLGKDVATTIIPVTESSMARSSGCSPMPLHDGLKYVAGDYLKYGGKPSKKYNYYDEYMKQLKGWVDSNKSDSRLKAIYEYLTEGRLIEDLIKAGIFLTDEDGNLIDTTSDPERPQAYKVVTGGVLKSFVRFNVESTGDVPSIWEDVDLYKLYIDYYTNKLKETNAEGYCYITGEYKVLSTMHGKYIRSTGDNAKLFSSSAGRELVYTGRMSGYSDVTSIGSVTSQKIHNVLRWLVAKKGVNIGGRLYLTYSKEDVDVVNVLDGAKMNENGTEEVTKEIRKAMVGQVSKNVREGLDKVTVIALDAIVEGRLALVFKEDLHVKDYYDKIMRWYERFRWYSNVRSKVTGEDYGTPSVKEVTSLVYWDMYGNSADVVKKNLYNRLIRTIVDGGYMGEDLVNRANGGVKMTIASEGVRKSLKELNILCAMVRATKRWGGCEIMLDNENNTRDYLFGRLIGIANFLERGILIEKDYTDKRKTKVEKYFLQFSQNPSRVWAVIRRELQPYLNDDSKRVRQLKNLLTEVESRLTVEDMGVKPLSPVYLLGFSSQLEALKKQYKKK